MNNEHEDEIDLVELFFLLKRKIWIILAAGLILATATGIFTEFCINFETGDFGKTRKKRLRAILCPNLII